MPPTPPETVLESVKQTQSIVNAVQGGLNQRIQDLAVQVAGIQRQPGQPLIEIGPDRTRLPGAPIAWAGIKASPFVVSKAPSDPPACRAGELRKFAFHIADYANVTRAILGLARLG
jgi:hypothetical protein